MLGLVGHKLVYKVQTNSADLRASTTEQRNEERPKGHCPVRAEDLVFRFWPTWTSVCLAFFLPFFFPFPCPFERVAPLPRPVVSFSGGTFSCSSSCSTAAATTGEGGAP